MTSSKYAPMQQASIGPLDTLFKYDVLLMKVMIDVITASSCTVHTCETGIIFGD